jgi:hypothetical protein
VPSEEYPLFIAALEMAAALPSPVVRRLLEHRAIALEAQLAGHEQAVAALTKQGLPRINLIEAEFGMSATRAELTWVRQIVADIDTGELTWTTDDEQHVDNPRTIKEFAS